MLDWNARRLAVLDHDIEAIIRTHAKDRRVAAWFEDAAEAFEEIGEYNLAIDWSRQATDFGPGHQSQQAAERWCRLLGEHRPDEVADARMSVFRRWPTATTAARLHDALGGQWESHRDEVLAVLSTRPNEAVLFALLTLKDPRRAWDLAHELALDNNQTWSTLLETYEKIDPIAVLPTHQRLAVDQLVETNAKHYRVAARRLAKMRKLAAGTAKSTEVDQLIADLRETHRRRPRLQQEFDRAGLP